MKKTFALMLLAGAAAFAGHHGYKVPHRDLYVGMDIAAFVLDILAPRQTVVEERTVVQPAPVAVAPTYVAPTTTTTVVPPSVPEVTYVAPTIQQQTYVVPQVVQPVTTSTTYIVPTAPRYVSPWAGRYYAPRPFYRPAPPPPPRHYHMAPPRIFGGPGHGPRPGHYGPRH